MKNFYLAFILLVSINSQAAIDDFNLSYGKLPKEENGSFLEENRIHIGAALSHSFQDFQVAPNRREKGGVRGFELSLGLDLFSPNWIAQALVSNYPETTFSDVSLATNSFELRLLYERPILYGVTLHGGLGLGNRFYNIKEKSKTNSFQSGSTAFVFGANYWPAGELSTGIEITNHLPMGSGDEPSSVDLSVKFTGHF